jgi:uncharacterized repeat protein (TIGR03803 family)
MVLFRKINSDMKRILSNTIYSSAAILVLALLTGVANELRAQTPGELWGVTYAGGQDNLGVILKDAVNSTLLVPRYEFLYTTPGKSPQYTQLLQATNGKLYGMTQLGGTSDKGVLFEYDPATGVYTKKLNFNGTNGGTPFGGLIQATNGKLYGMTNTGGANNLGVLFEYDLTTSTYTKRIDFAGSSNGANPRGNLFQASNGKLYGMTGAGGLSATGVIFEFDAITNVLTKKIDFSSIVNDGRYGYGSFVQAANGKLYGLTLSGGTSSRGTIMEFDPAMSAYAKKFDFTGPTGDTPYASLTKGSNGKLYGTTISGGTLNGGVIFEYDPATNTTTKKIDLNGSNVSNGSAPVGGLIQTTNGKFYGLVSNGGANVAGALYEYDLTSNTYTRKVSFDGANGSTPFGTLMQATNGKCYGMTSTSNTGNGVLFEYDPLTAVLAKKLDFQATGNGFGPTGELAQGLNNKLYGTTSTGTPGILFEFDPTTLVFSKKVDFVGSNGTNAQGGVIRVGSKLYGTTTSGGITSYGVLFEYDLTNSAYTVKQDFDYSNTGFGANGKLTLTPDGMLYGMTQGGGSNGGGTIFEYNLSTDVLTKKVDFVSTTGISPYGSLVLATNGKYYGLASGGGANNQGTLFEFDRNTNTLTAKVDLAGASNGEYPYGGLTIAGNGKLYGMTSSGGANGNGVLFEFDPSSSTLTKKADFTSATTGSGPRGTLVLSGNGKLYGFTQSGGASGLGTFFEYDPATGILTKKVDLAGGNGSSPSYGALIVWKGNQTITFGALADKVMGDAPFSLTATASSSLPVTLSSTSPNITLTGNQVVISAPGRVNITASQSGNVTTLDAPAVTQSFCVRPSKPVITATNTTTNTHTLTSSATTGNTWYLNGTPIPGASGTSIQVSQPGTYTVLSKVDDCTSDPSADMVVTTQSITFNTVPDKTLGTAPFALTGTASSSLPLTYAASSGKITIAGSQVTLVSAGRVTITANQPGAVGFFPATPVDQSFCILPAKPVITTANPNSATPILTSSAPGGNQWYRNGTLIANATGTTLQINSVGTYKVRSQADDCISVFSDDQVFVVTGDIPTMGSGITVYPNPVSDWLTVSLDDLPGTKEVGIFQVTGKKMESQELTNGDARFYVADYSRGIYVVRVVSEAGSRTIRFVKQ